MTRLRALLRNRRGVAATEFALCLPFLVALYLGGYQLSDAISAYRKVTTTTRTLADLTSQYTAVTDTDLTMILNASTQVLTPYNANNATFVISQIKIDPSSGAATVDWSEGRNTTGLTKGAAYTVPASIKVKGTYLIVATINYTYVPVVAPDAIGTIPMRDTIFMSPRASDYVARY